MEFHIKDPDLAGEGKRRIEWADHDMPVLKLVRERFRAEGPLKGLKISACLHVTAETANLMRALKSGGADVVLCASNPLSTQDDVAASLVKDYKVPVFAINGEDTETYYKHIESAIDHNPVITMDDGADLVFTIHSKYKQMAPQILCSMEETTTGVIRLKAMEKKGALKIPVISVNDAATKHLFDNRYGTGQSTIDGIIRATDVLLAGKKIVAAGYGMCGRGFASRARGMGAHVIVTEVDPVRALEAVMDGFQVMSMDEAAPVGDLFCTLTGDINVIRKEHFEKMKDGTIVCNSGHFNVEIDLKTLDKISVQVKKGVRKFVDCYILKNGRRIYILGEGRLVNLSAAEGHPASVMDMSFSLQALSAEYASKNRLRPGVYSVPQQIDSWVARLKLKTMGVRIDELSKEQRDYLSSWDVGT
ncbi:MAG: adenosylhomocysteinase [Fidelibacterota bacterium]